MRTGVGFDVHAFVKGRKLILGGIEIPFDKGLAGHSDADVILHAITDALLGSLALGDIGIHFPNTDKKFKNAESLIFTKKAKELVEEIGFSINNIDVAVALEKPKISPHLLKIRENISRILELSVDRISIKATTSEKLGFVGREEGAFAYAVATVVKKVK
ncbi:MAG: 2-C-methyl-D-erythritol 2,4-cyclodiphosphate synthase [Ignavibacteria bacterium]|nr:2-C-methyl-D-erythritol 2,4-cyclodiphosphate synthase [Ignavibacteria bacterium]MBT8382479.1 2-C-methyl-D-erythritol 2,4-cyclodiphosphate synthase [Ignavibacteria bacterium]MBT8391814.1 2-C-methyl-D-erythritol 2,4-cyclodiphosphate synthase [Ignavibacteria bacterium]NNJ51875.1 2-C-methyl-D-erythritol 2,4-cyclodiphosphate synthase [Ignavibacteriaceae bacterium]NNL21916.1 2-C-methyl-D-erythritol 2,4-cyclodiphosphate synthase [Ignavibacteriaceae bacterium]